MIGLSCVFSICVFVTDDSPKPAPRQVSRQGATKPSVASLSLKLQTPKKLSVSGGYLRFTVNLSLILDTVLTIVGIDLTCVAEGRNPTLKVGILHCRLKSNTLGWNPTLSWNPTL